MNMEEQRDALLAAGFLKVERTMQKRQSGSDDSKTI
jgi:hypothetical protein